MNFALKTDPHRLQVFHEGRKRRTFVGELIYSKEKDRYEFTYNRKYTLSRNAIPVGPDLNLFKLHHVSKRGEIFKSIHDRIPDKSNPAYADYCLSQGISPNEKNLILLLGTIAHRGPSSFIFEPVYKDDFNVSDIKKLREELQITQHDFAEAFDINQQTLQRMESGASQDLNTLKRIQILLNFPEVALWQLKKSSARVHSSVSSRLIRHFQSLG
jgi:DNA-binding XRE family transcriptional regulator